MHLVWAIVFFKLGLIQSCCLKIFEPQNLNWYMISEPQTLTDIWYLSHKTLTDIWYLVSGIILLCSLLECILFSLECFVSVFLGASWFSLECILFSLECFVSVLLEANSVLFRMHFVWAIVFFKLDVIQSCCLKIFEPQNLNWYSISEPWNFNWYLISEPQNLSCFSISIGK